MELFKQEFDVSKDEFEFKENRLAKFLKLSGRNLLALGVIVFIWYLIVWIVSYTRGVTFPSPLQTFIRLVKLLLVQEELNGYTIYEHILHSFLFRWFIGYALAVVIGLILGVLMGASKLIRDIFMPFIYIIQLIPGLAWIPIALLLFGIGNPATIFMIFITALAPIVINTSGGIQGVPVMYVRAARMMGASRLRVFLQVMLPASILSVVNGLRIGFANGWRVLIAAEMIVGVGVGLGYSIIQGTEITLDYEAAFVCILIICLIGISFEKGVFALIEKTITKKMGLENGK